MSIDRVIILPGPEELTPEQEREIERECRVFHAQAAAFTWRNLFALTALAWFARELWPYSPAFAEIARYWIKRDGYELSLIGSALMLLVFGIQGTVRNRRARNKREAVSA